MAERWSHRSLDDVSAGSGNIPEDYIWSLAPENRSADVVALSNTYTFGTASHVQSNSEATTPWEPHPFDSAIVREPADLLRSTFVD